MKLGKLQPRHDKRTLRAHAYTRRKSYPRRRDWLGDVRFPMYRNDEIGDCTCASFGHLTLAQSASADGAKRAIRFRTPSILAAYSAISGYDRETGSNDDGAVMLDCLHYFNHTGIARRRIGAYAAVDFANMDRLLTGLNLFGGVYAGFSLPDAAIEIAFEAAGDSFIWPKPPKKLTGRWAPNPENGHAVFGGRYSVPDQEIEFPTWGMRAIAHFDFVRAYMDECYVVVSEAWTNDVGQAPSGVNLRQLMADRSEVGK